MCDEMTASRATEKRGRKGRAAFFAHCNFFHELTGDVGSPVHLKLSVVDIGSLLCCQWLSISDTTPVEQKRPAWNVNEGRVLRIG
jgi:hypothetical protein